MSALPVGRWLPVVNSVEQAFRNKAKMVVSGSVERPLLGMLHRDGTAVDLCECPLYPDAFAAVFDTLKVFIARAGLTPYNVERKRGELKYLLLTESQKMANLCCALYCARKLSWHSCVRHCLGYSSNCPSSR